MIWLADEAATRALGAAFARGALQSIHESAEWTARAMKLYLSGELGVGKTCFAGGFLRALGVERAVRSPSYSLLELYTGEELRLADGRLGGVVHLDLYRLADADEIETLGLSDFDQPGWIWLVEWPARAARALPQADIELRWEHASEGRTLRWRAVGAAARALADGACSGRHNSPE